MKPLTLALTIFIIAAFILSLIISYNTGYNANCSEEKCGVTVGMFMVRMILFVWIGISFIFIHNILYGGIM